MEWVETTGKTVSDAKDAALDRLGVASDEAEFEVIEEPKTGLFGRLRGQARVRARVKPAPVRPKQERRRRGSGRRGERSKSPAPSASAERSTDAEAERSAAESEVPSKETAPSDPANASDRSDAPVATESAPGEDAGTRPSSNRSGQRRRRGSRGRGGQQREDRPAVETENGAEAAATADDSAPNPDPDDDQNDAGATSDTNQRGDDVRSSRPRSAKKEQPMSDDQLSTVTPDEVGAAAHAFVDGLVDAFGATGTTSVVVEGEEIAVTVDGDDLGRLVGPKGRTLVAVQDLARVASQRKLGDHDTRLKVDVGGYRERRQAALVRFTKSVAETVRETGEARSLEPMNSADRKVVHDVLNDEPGVSSRSEGDDPNRRVIIVPS